MLEFINVDKSFKAVVTEVRTYPSLEEYLQDVQYENAVPGAQSFQEAVDIYHQWSTPAEIERHGFLALFINVIDANS